MSAPNETLGCAACGQVFTRERKRGVKPKNCPDCTQTLIEATKAAAHKASAQKTQKLHCENCNQDWTRPAQRGKPPKRCPSCSGNRHPQNAQAYPQLVASTPQQVPSKSNHHSVERLLEQYTNVPVEERYKFNYIESELARGQREDSDQVALKRVWATLEGRLS